MVCGMDFSLCLVEKVKGSKHVSRAAQKLRLLRGCCLKDRYNMYSFSETNVKGGI